MNPSTPLSLSYEIGTAMPELWLAIGALVMILIGAYRGERAGWIIEAIAIGVLIGAAAVLFNQPEGRVVTFNGSFVTDPFARFMKFLTLTGSIAAIILSREFMERHRIARFEYPILIVLATLGMMMMISANDLIALYVGLELQSLALYVVASIHRDDAKSSEAGLKYFVLGALSSGMLLYGCSFIYGFTGSVSFEAIDKALAAGRGAGVIFGLVFVICGLAFKISAVPFHMWTPDVYEGAPTPVTAFFASAPKMAAMAMTSRVLADGFPAITKDWQQVIAFIAIASMLLGAFAAIGQTNIKRLMAYSSIGNMGYALVGLAAGTVAGIEGVAIFMAIYLAMTLGVFACILAMRTENGDVTEIAALSGLSRTRPAMAMILAALLFSLIGIPPLAGFFGKFYVFAAAIEAKLYWLAVIGIVTSVVSAFYYLRIIKIMYIDEASQKFVAPAMGVQAVMILAGLFVVLFGIMPGPLRQAAYAAARSLF